MAAQSAAHAIYCSAVQSTRVEFIKGCSGHLIGESIRACKDVQILTIGNGRYCFCCKSKPFTFSFAIVSTLEKVKWQKLYFLCGDIYKCTWSLGARLLGQPPGPLDRPGPQPRTLNPKPPTPTMDPRPQTPDPGPGPLTPDRTNTKSTIKSTFMCFFSCPEQLNRWPCH